MYIQMVSVHGLVRGENIEMGRDADTGGQVRYVIELARTLGQHEAVDQVDLFTRRIRDKRVSPTYSQEIERLGPKSRLIRLPCGGGRYRPRKTVAAHPASCVRHAFAESWRRSAGGADAARPQRHIDHTDLYPRRGPAPA